MYLTYLEWETRKSSWKAGFLTPVLTGVFTCTSRSSKEGRARLVRDDRKQAGRWLRGGQEAAYDSL